MLMIASTMLWLLATTDIILHDSYVVHIVAECYEGNDSSFCEKMRERHNCEATDQLCLGNKYWGVLQMQAITFGFILFVMRMGILKLAKGKFTDMGIFTATLWGSSIAILFLFGGVDVAYYEFRGLDIPETLPWLNEVGVFNYTKQITGDPETVEKMDLYITMIIGLFVLIMPWMISVYKYKQMRKIRKRLQI